MFTLLHKTRAKVRNLTEKKQLVIEKEMRVGITAVIAGASGQTGKQLLERILNDMSYKRVIVLSRKSIRISHPKLEEYITDFKEIDSLTFWPDADILFCCIGTTIRKAGNKENFRMVDYHIPVNLSRPCSVYSVDYYLISSMGADSGSSNFYLRTKGETEEAIMNSGVENVVIFRPSMLMGKREELRIGEMIGKVLMGVFGFMLGRYRGVSSEKVAEVMSELGKIGEKGKRVVENWEIIGW